MERGLLWLPLLGVFIWLAWAGWSEYQKVEAYRLWAAQFQHAKYDIYAVLGQNGSDLTWGRPTRKGPINLQNISLKEVKAIQLRVAGEVVDLQTPPSSDRQVVLEITPTNHAKPIQIPFTDAAIAAAWGQRLQQELSAQT